ncbi:MAG: FimV/HubP family polar landmark protein [Gammaproteobacteria bacterium]|tara:strand:+ start:1354 stop:2724 length:1371 start_codon:yes stop_codon:yes gene_type:complete
MKRIVAFLLTLSFGIQADIALSSPKVNVNEQGQFLIRFSVNSDSAIRSKDFVLNEYQSEIPLEDNLIAFTLFEEEGDTDKFTIALGNDYPEDYFSFQLVIKDELKKNVFIFLPSRYKSFSRQPAYEAPKETLNTTIASSSADQLIEESLSESIQLIEDDLVTIDSSSQDVNEQEEEVIIKSSEITTIWSLASSITAEVDADIYQVMWAIFLANEAAFIDGNINLVRADIDLVIPADSVLSNISSSFAKDSIQAMNSSTQRIGVSKNIKSILTLTAPKDDIEIVPTTSEVIEEIIEPIIQEPKTVDLANLNPEDFIETNSKTIELGAENEPLEKLQEAASVESNAIGALDLLLVGLAALVVGFVIAIFYIQRNTKTSVSVIEEDIYDFDNPADAGGIEGLPSGLSVKNDLDTQQLDLAMTYVEMGNLDDAKAILEALVNSTDDDNLKAEAELLLLKT